MTSTIKVYNDTKIQRAKNFKIDDIETYLNDLDSIFYENVEFQYQKNTLNKIIRINVSQDNGEVTINTFRIDYVRIKNNEANSYPLYYFVVDKVWKGQETLELVLEMDTINTFFNNLENGLVFQDKTTILREHKDRFNENLKSVTGNTLKVARNIDIYNEGQLPKLFRKSTNVIRNSNADVDWYLVYKNPEFRVKTDLEVIDCLIYPSQQVQLANSTPRTNVDLFTLSQLPIYSDDVVWITWDLNPSCVITISSTATQTYTLSETGPRYVRISKGTTGMWNVWVYNGYKNGEVGDLIYNRSDVTHLYLNNFSTLIYSKPSEYTRANIENNVYKILYYPIFPSIYRLSPFSIVNRSNSKMIKIIKLPYSPFTIDTSITSIPSWYELQSGGLRKTNIEDTNQCTLVNKVTQLNENVINIDLSSIKNYQKGNMNYESKLYHSDYHYYKFYYDSFSIGLDLEKCKASLTFNYDIVFKATNTVNSKFLFNIEGYETDGKGEEDFDKYICVSRNNEITIYSNEFINYIKTGYNYDLKNKSHQVMGQVINSVSGAGSNIAQTGLMSSLSETRNAFFKASLAGSAISLVGNIASTINSEMSAQNNINEKLTRKLNQATSISGSDDVDLMSDYTSNRLRVSLYEVSDKMKENLYNLFYYAGYIGNVQKIPDTNSRTYFNFVQCLPVFIVNANINDDMLEDVKSRFQEGVTFIHNVNNFWDVNQTMENWEKWIYNMRVGE